ncbi:MAG: PRTRC system protein B [Rhodanobacter sp.]
MIEKLHPKAALLVHASDKDARSGIVLTLHSLLTGRDGPLLDAGRILTPDEARGLGERLLGRGVVADIAELIPVTVLRTGADVLTWYRPASVSIMHWRTARGMESIAALLPSLVFDVRRRVLRVAAFVGSERPNAATPLYHAPIGNVHADTVVCTGSVSLPVDTAIRNAKDWSEVLLASSYSHVNHPHAIQSKGQVDTAALLAFWRKRKQSKTPPGERLLAPLRDSLSQWLQREGD